MIATEHVPRTYEQCVSDQIWRQVRQVSAAQKIVMGTSGSGRHPPNTETTKNFLSRIGWRPWFSGAQLIYGARIHISTRVVLSVEAMDLRE